MDDNQNQCSRHSYFDGKIFSFALSLITLSNAKKEHI